MSVTFNRAQLIKVAENALKAHDRAIGEHAQAVAKYKADHARDNARTADLRRLRDYLTVQLNKKNGPITLATVRREVNGGNIIENLFYTPPADYEVRNAVTAPKALLSPAELVETRSLLQVLQAATGDTVSANELKLLGLKNLAPVFTAAANEATKR